MQEPSNNTILILYSEIFSSEENLDYWKKKLKNQFKEKSSFGLVAVLPDSNKSQRVSKGVVEKYKRWICRVKPTLEKKCYGYAIVSSNQIYDKKYSHSYLNQIKNVIGADCCYFLELHEAIKWLDEKNVE